MQIGVLTLFPEQLQQLQQFGVVGRAMRQGQVSLHCYNPRDYTDDPQRRVDDRAYGGGPGMVMRVEPLTAALAAARQQLGSPLQTICLSPQGQLVTHRELKLLNRQKKFIIICGRYEGVDERFLESEVDVEWSIGDFVTSGGELPAMCLIDAAVRLIPGVLGNPQSAQQDSFVDGLLDCPHYTRPEVLHDRAVPSVLLSGDHQAIRRWRLQQALGRTWQRRPDLLKKRQLNDEEKMLLAEYKDLHDANRHQCSTPDLTNGTSDEQ